MGVKGALIPLIFFATIVGNATLETMSVSARAVSRGRTEKADIDDVGVPTV